MAAGNRPNDLRLRYFGVNDYGTYFQIDKAFSLLGSFNASRATYTVDDVIEFYHALQFVNRGLFPSSSTQQERDARLGLKPDLHRVVSRFFAELRDDNFASTVINLDFQYHQDLLELLAKFTVFERCTPVVVLNALTAANVRCGELLACKPLVSLYNEDLRTIVLADVKNAELIISKYLLPDIRRPLFLPASITPSDCRSLLASYVDSADANPSFVNLIATARPSKENGVDARLKLKAKRAHEKSTKEFFEHNAGMKTGCEVSIVKGQTNEVEASLDGLVGKYSYSEAWLTENLDYPTVLNNFIYLFDFANLHMLLLLPSYPSQLGVFERSLFMTGKDSYRTGASFRHTDQASYLQTLMYTRFLQEHGVELEAVIEWFFATYLKDQFGAENFKFRPSSAVAPYLEKCRHLFSETESVLKQFRLYAEDGELDRDLLSMTSEQLSYKDVPSQIQGKYVYSTDHSDMQRTLNLLFSDQSHMTYINQALQDTSLARLIILREVGPEDFLDYQKHEVEFLLAHRIVQDNGGRLKFTSSQQFLVLKELWDHEADSYFQNGPKGRAAIGEMEAKGWVYRKSSLLTPAEAGYFNYFLNQVDFTDGPDLRNRYLHGSQADGDDDRVHLQTYTIAMRTLLALVIKINDDFSLHAGEEMDAT